jgi:hypothetical protein
MSQKASYRSPFCKSQTEVGTKHPCLAQQQAATPVASKLRRLLEEAALTARWFRQDGLWFNKSKEKPKHNMSIKMYHTWLWSYTQVLFVAHLLDHISFLAIGQHNIKIWSTHPDVIRMKVGIHRKSSTSHPTWEFLPVCRKIDSWLWARGAEKCKASRSRSWCVNRSETF